MKSFEIITLTVEEMMKSVTQLREYAAKTGEAIGYFAALAPILTLLGKAEGERDKIWPAMRFLCKQFKVWNIRFGSVGSIDGSLDIIIRSIDKEIK